MLVFIAHSFIYQLCLLLCNMLVLITHSFIHHLTLHTTHYHSYMSYLYGLHVLIYRLYIRLRCYLLLTWLFTHPPFLSSSTSSWPPPKQQPDSSHSSNPRTNSSRSSSRHNIVTDPFKQAGCYDHGQCQISTCSHKDNQ